MAATSGDRPHDFLAGCAGHLSWGPRPEYHPAEASMTHDILAQRIASDPTVKFGRPVIAVTRVPVDVILEEVANGMTLDEVAAQYGVTLDDVRAALAYATKLVNEQRVIRFG